MNGDEAPTVAEIAELVARLRLITNGDPAEKRETFLADKRDLLARIEATR